MTSHPQHKKLSLQQYLDVVPIQIELVYQAIVWVGGLTGTRNTAVLPLLKFCILHHQYSLLTSAALAKTSTNCMLCFLLDLLHKEYMGLITPTSHNRS